MATDRHTADAATCHCGRVAEPRDPDPWEGRLDGYCYDCATNRCDCYPDECSVKYPTGRSTALIETVKVADLAEDQEFIGKVADRLLAEHRETLRKLAEDEADDRPAAPYKPPPPPMPPGIAQKDPWTGTWRLPKWIARRHGR